MTVQDAIDILSKYPPHATVLVADWNECYREPFPARIIYCAPGVEVPDGTYSKQGPFDEPTVVISSESSE